MLTENEEAFIVYWQKNRQRQKKGIYQLLVGLPVGLLLGAVIAFNFYSGWYNRADSMVNADFNPMVLIVALIIIAVFIAVFSKRFQWDQREQKYRELLVKKEKLKTDTTKTEN
jgi:uncharacterized membrane protein